ncbi:hypothetical protein ACN2WE_05190 [Streptomyces sp. cg28]|uniref:hypothetical protein n=1 Tax=Streptomyces sp. cg28 TaxID=3403457 RepID=UPI003B210A52
MTMPLPEPRPTTTAGQRHPEPTYDSLEEVMKQAAAEAVKDLAPTAYRDDTETPRIGTAPPKVQPGQPPMSQWAVDLSRTMLAAGASSFMLGTPIVGILWASHNANPTVITVIFTAPVALVLAISRVMGRAKAVAEAAPREVHNHNHGPVTIRQDQSQHHSKTIGISARTTHNPKEES